MLSLPGLLGLLAGLWAWHLALACGLAQLVPTTNISFKARGFNIAVNILNLLVVHSSAVLSLYY